MELECVGGPHGGKPGGDGQALDKGTYLPVLFELSRLLPVPGLALPVKLGVRVDGEHIGPDEPGVELVAHLGGGLGPHFSPARAGDAHQVEEAIPDPRLIQPFTLGNDVGGGIALVHEGQGLIVPGLDANSETIIAGLSERGNTVNWS